MQPHQSVSEMAQEALERQAEALAQRRGLSLEDARQAVSDTEAGRQLRDLASGEHRHERAQELAGECVLGAGRGEIDAPLCLGGSLALCSRTPLLVARGLHGVVGRQGGAQRSTIRSLRRNSQALGDEPSIVDQGSGTVRGGGFVVAAVRQLTDRDFDTVDRIQRSAYSPDFLEDLAVFADKFARYPDGCWVAEVDGQVVGYLFSHPGHFSAPPA